MRAYFANVSQKLIRETERHPERDEIVGSREVKSNNTGSWLDHDEGRLLEIDMMILYN